MEQLDKNMDDNQDTCWKYIDYKDDGHPHVSVDKDGTETIFREKPIRGDDKWSNVIIEYGDEGNIISVECIDCIVLPKGSIKKLTGKTITWEDEPIPLEI